MRRLLRWIGLGLAGLVGLLIIACAVLYAVSERMLRRTYEIPAVALTVPTDPESIAEGRRLATVRGCFNGCHGKNAEGAMMFDQPIIARVVAPNLTAAVRRYSDAELAVIVRRGIRPDGRTLLIMPAEVFGAMSDADLGRIIAFLKSLPPAAGPGPSVSVGPIGRAGLAVGKFKTVAQLVADARPPPEATSQQAVFGRYLARTICGQCHGTDLRGDSNPDFTSPDLRIVGAYSPEAFIGLMRTGVAVGERKLGVMSGWALKNLSQLTDEEIAALYSYLHALGPN
jgi:mono/diheme cytochrome c family protein